MKNRGSRLRRPQVPRGALRKVRAAGRALWRAARFARPFARHLQAFRPTLKQIIGGIRWSAMMAAWNVVALVSLIVLLSLLGTDQGLELLKIDTESAPGVLDQFRRVGVPLTIYAVSVTLASVLVGRSGTRRLADLAERFGLPAVPVQRGSRLLIPLAIGFAPFVLLGRSTKPGWPVLLTAGAIAAAVLYPWLRAELFAGAEVHTRARQAIASSIVFALTFVGVAIICVLPDQARAVGAAGVVLCGLAFWTSVLSLVFVALPLRFGLPGLALLAPVPWLIASFLHDPNQFPRPFRTGSSARDQVNSAAVSGIHDQFVRWIASSEHPGEGFIPVYLVSAEGGGLRAAFWTARTLSELNFKSASQFARHAFVYSGVSGGSLGIAAFLGVATKHPILGGRVLEDFLGRDYLAPLVGRLMLTEPIWQLLGAYSGVLPRDVAFERQWERDWQAIEHHAHFSRRFADVFAGSAARSGPAVVFNATNSETGKRVLLANVDAAVVANDYLFPLTTDGVAERLSDVTLGEVVHLSARFPFISPPASMQMVVPTGIGREPVERLWGHVVDGGYFDNSGGLALRDVYESLSELRDAARRGIGYSSSDPDVDWERARPLIARARFHILVIRNDPLASPVAEKNSYPTVTDNRIINLWGDSVTKAFKEGEFGRNSPVRGTASELLVPIDAALSTREARASATRRALWERVSRAVGDLQYQCEVDRRVASQTPMVVPFTLSQECLAAQVDKYTEISLGKDIAENVDEPDAGAKTACDLDDARGIALGWMLADRSKRAMSCMASQDQDIAAVAAELNPPQ
jgi:hypothetical protein